MYNWSVNTKRLKKNPDLFEKWELEQMINYGLGGSKLEKKALKKHFAKLHIDKEKKEFLEFLLWPSRF